MLALMSFMGHNVLERFPSLNIGYMGAGSGWLPYWLERVDEHWGGPFGAESPSNEAPSLLFKRQGFVTVEPGERTTPEVVEESRATLDTLAAEAGRDPASLTISVTGQPADRDLMRAYDAAGADRVIIRPSAVVGEEEMSRELERIAEAVLA